MTDLLIFQRKRTFLEEDSEGAEEEGDTSLEENGMRQSPMSSEKPTLLMERDQTGRKEKFE